MPYRQQKALILIWKHKLKLLLNTAAFVGIKRYLQAVEQTLDWQVLGVSETLCIDSSGFELHLTL